MAFELGHEAHEQAWAIEIKRQSEKEGCFRGFVLVDCSVVSKTDQAWLDAQNSHSLFAGTPDEAHSHLAPRLLPLPKDGPALSVWLKRLAVIELSLIHI
mgnify:FL=1